MSKGEELDPRYQRIQFRALEVTVKSGRGQQFLKEVKLASPKPYKLSEICRQATPPQPGFIGATIHACACFTDSLCFPYDKQPCSKWPQCFVCLSRSAVMDVMWRSSVKGSFSKLCSLGGIAHPLSRLFGALAYLRSHDAIKLKSEVTSDSPGEGKPRRFQLALRVMLTQKILTFDGPSPGGADLYDSIRVK